MHIISTWHNLFITGHLHYVIIHNALVHTALLPIILDTILVVFHVLFGVNSCTTHCILLEVVMVEFTTIAILIWTLYDLMNT